MPPNLCKGNPILVDLDALPRRRRAAAIDLMGTKAVPKNAILVERPDPLAALIAFARRKKSRA
jgi:hypothetical protein